MTLESMFDTNGYRVDDIMGEKRYVTSDDNGRSVVGPLSHRRRPRSRAYRHPQPAQTQAAATILASSGEEVAVGIAPVQVRDERPGKWRSRWLNRDVHRAIQHTALDVLLWATALSAGAVVLKLAYWVVTL